MSRPPTTAGDERSDGVPRSLGPDDRYCELQLLGTGGAGRVFAARDRIDGRRVALKELRGLSPRAVFRIKREFRTLAGLQHRNVVAVHEMFMHEGALWYAMEFVDGKDIVSYCRAGIGLSGRLAAVAAQLVDALATIHRSGLLHRDLKPANLLVTEAGRLVVLDFGVVKNLADVEREGVTQERGWVGTPAYMAPEQFVRAKPDPAADWYAVGAVLYECLTGRPAFEQRDVGRLLDAKCTAGFVPLGPSDAPHELAGLVSSLLEADPRRRAGPHQIREVVGYVAGAAFEMGSDGELVGRDEELAAMERAFVAAVRTGRAHLVALAAPPGLGRSRLMAAFRDDVRGQMRAVVASVRAHALESLRLPAIDGLLDDLLGHAGAYSGFDLPRCQPRNAGALLEVFPTAAVAFKLAPADEKQRGAVTLIAALDALVDTLQRVAQQAPVVLLIDDLHACDADELDAILRVVLGSSESPVLVVTSHALGIPGAAAVETYLASAAAYLGADRLTRIDLGGLAPRDLREVVRGDLAHWRGPEALVERLCTFAHGSPRLCRWYARELARAGVDVYATAGDGLAHALVAQAIADRSPGARRVLGLLALAGGELPRAALASLVGGGEEYAALALELEHAHVLLRLHYVDAEFVRAWHAGIADHLLRGMTDEQRQTEHRALATALDALGPDHEDLAERHWRRAGELARADTLALVVGRRAREQGRHHRAAQVLRELLPRIEDAASRAAITTDLIDSLGRVGRHREAGERARESLRAGGLEPDAQRRTLRAAVGHYAALARPETVRELVGDVVRHPTLAMARLVALRTRIEVRKPWQRTSADPGAQEAIDHELELLWTAGSRLLHVAPIDAAMWLGRHLELAFKSGTAWHRAIALGYEAVMTTSSGNTQLSRACTMLSLAEQTAALAGDPRCRAHVHFAAGFMWGNLGRFREAIDEGRQAVAVLESLPQIDPAELAHARVELGWRLLMLGELREVLATAASRTRDAVQCGDPVLATALHVQCANASLAADRPLESRRCLDEAEHHCPRAYEVGRFALCIARLAVELYVDRPEAALAKWRRAEAELDALRIMSLPAVRAICDYTIGTVISRASAARGGDRELDRRLERIARDLAGAGLEVSTAHARMIEASIESRRGRFTSAAGLVREARVRYEQLGWSGMTALAMRVHRRQIGLPDDPAIDDRLAASGVVSPDAWTRTLVPHIAIG